MTPDEYLHHDATSLAALVRDGEVTADELRQAATAQHERTHETINAVVEWYDDPAPPSPSSEPGPLAGVPFLRKDAGSAEAGRLVEMGTRLLVGQRATATSPYYTRMLAAGVQVLGRTAVPEFALHGTTESVLSGITRNPVDPTTSVGGSSGGAAAAVRAGVVPLAHATDAAGSIRIPAAVTGLYGLKPTRGLMPPPDDRWCGLVCEFVLGRSIRDLETCLDVLSDTVPSQSPAELAGPLQIALCVDHWAGHPNDAATTAAVEAAARDLESAGHKVAPVNRPFDYEQLMSTWFPLFGGGVVDMIDQAVAATGRPADADHLEANTLALLAIVAEHDPGARTRALAAAAAITRVLSTSLASFDALLTPTLDRPVIPLGRMAGDTPMEQYLSDGDEWFDRLYIANTSGWPAISVPAPVADPAPEAAPPIGLQLIAPPGRERRLLRLAREITGDLVVPAIGAVPVP